MNGGDDRQGSPPWVWATLVALALVTLTAGAIVGMVTTDERDGPAALATGAEEPPAAGEGPSAAPTVPVPTTDVLPPTVTIPPITDVPIDTGVTDTGTTDPGFTETFPDTSTTPSAAGTWPSGQSGYTVVLASVAEVQGRGDADAIAQRATAAGLPQVGVLFSTDYTSLRPGYWVTYSGVYSTEAQARAAVPQARSSGFPTAYPRPVTP